MYDWRSFIDIYFRFVSDYLHDMRYQTKHDDLNVAAGKHCLFMKRAPDDVAVVQSSGQWRGYPRAKVATAPLRPPAGSCSLSWRQARVTS